MPETQEPQESPVGLKGFLKERTCEKKTFPKNEKRGRNVYRTDFSSSPGNITTIFVKMKSYLIPSIIGHVNFARLKKKKKEC